jgi:hypothetical protein
VSLPELGDLLKSRGESRQLAAPTQSLHGLQLVVCGSARPDQVRVVGIRQAIGPRARGRYDRAFFEEQHGPTRAGKGECARDRFYSFRVGDSVPPAVEDSEAHSFLVCDACEEVGALGPGAADLKVRGSGTAERTAPEQGSAQIRRAAARPGDHAPRRALEWRQAGGEHSGFVEDLQRAIVSGDVQLVPRAPVEGVPRVRPDLGRDAERAQKAEGSASDRRVNDIEMHRDLAAALQVHASRGVKKP